MSSCADRTHSCGDDSTIQPKPTVPLPHCCSALATDPIPLKINKQTYKTGSRLRSVSVAPNTGQAFRTVQSGFSTPSRQRRKIDIPHSIHDVITTSFNTRIHRFDSIQPTISVTSSQHTTIISTSSTTNTIKTHTYRNSDPTIPHGNHSHTEVPWRRTKG